MNPEIKNFLIKNRLCVLSIVNDNGNPYSATVFYAFQENPLAFYFLTDKHTKKVDGLLQGISHKASIVIGFTEGVWYTFQAVGAVSLVDATDEKTAAEAMYFLKFPTAQSLIKHPELVLLKFTPVHWKYTDVNPDVWKIYTSED